MKIKRSEVTNLAMIAGNESKFTRIILNNEIQEWVGFTRIILNNKIQEWVGFGWITLRDAKPKDYEKYPLVAYQATIEEESEVIDD